MKKGVLMIVSVLIYGVLLTSCSSDNVDLQDGITEEVQDRITEEPQDEVTEEPHDGVTEELQDEITEEPEELNGEIIYPTNGKYGLKNILADGFVEAIATSEKRVEYSVNADLSVGNSSLKIVIKTKREKAAEGYEWGGISGSSLENWLVSGYDNDLKSNTFTVYESGKTANATVIFYSNCIIEYYENGATMPTKVKEIKVMQ